MTAAGPTARSNVKAPKMHVRIPPMSSMFALSESWFPKVDSKFVALGESNEVQIASALKRNKPPTPLDSNMMNMRASNGSGANRSHNNGAADHSVAPRNKAV